MQDEKLTQIEELANSASPGPWTADSETRGDCVVWGPNGRFLMNQQAAPHWMEYPGETRAVSFDVDRRDGEFIAVARTAVPEMAATIRDLQEQIDRVRALAQEAFEKGRYLQQIPETKLAGTAYAGMAQRILGALAGDDA